MSDRWVCRRCFADNEEIDAVCARCGHTRGADATIEDQRAWAAQTGGTPIGEEPPAWRRWLRFWWIPAIAIFLAVGYFSTARRGDDGSLTSAGRVPVNDLRAGDCFNTGDETEISDVDGVPCTEPHEYEVFAVDTHQADALPSDSELEGIFASICLADFEDYVGAPYETSSIYASMISPSEGSWSDGDRTFTCVLYDPDDAELTESLRGAAR
ncbi:MAG TPA: septum formation family protein [Patescibacteria group bacterium]|nr:septum formation family protein [Patescibacteria group bacterium]